MKVAKNSCLERAREVLDLEIEGICKVRDSLGEPFLGLVEHCLDAFLRGGKIVLSGIGKSGHIAQKIAATLASTGSPAVFMHPVEAMHGDLGLLSAKDVLIAVSYSGETEEVLAVLPAARRFDVPIIALTGNMTSSLAEWSDLTIPMTVDREACPFNLAPTTSTTALLALGDALAIVLLERRGFEKEDYARLHPAGAIGRSITLRVGDIMRKGDALPRIRPGVPVREALVEMTRVRSGSVAVVDDNDMLLGIFTDGDFRRHITADPGSIQAPIETVMTRNPITIKESAMAVELLKLVEGSRIDDVLVVDDTGRVVGLVDTQDLPRFKVM